MIPTQPNESTDSHWNLLKQKICERKPIFNHYFSQCKIFKFDESNLTLGFIDAITLDQVKDLENLNLIKDIAKSVFNREMNIRLILNDKPSITVGDPINKKKVNNINRQKTEAEIIQDALDVFGGIVIK